MDRSDHATYVAFVDERQLATGDLRDVARAAKRASDRSRDASILVFDTARSDTVDIDLRGSIDDVLGRLPKPMRGPNPAGETEPSPPRGPGRPKLGVVAREITLLPRHWDWLAQQKGGASVAIRKLVEQARRGSDDSDRIRRGQEAAYRFMSVMAGDRPHYEDAIRALFAGDPARLAELTAGWPADIRAHALKLAERAFPPPASRHPVDPGDSTR